MNKKMKFGVLAMSATMVAGMSMGVMAENVPLPEHYKMEALKEAEDPIEIKFFNRYFLFFLNF